MLTQNEKEVSLQLTEAMDKFIAMVDNLPTDQQKKALQVIKFILANFEYMDSISSTKNLGTYQTDSSVLAKLKKIDLGGENV